MKQVLPFGDFKEVFNVDLDDILNTNDDNEIGYVVLVDLNYPKTIKERTKHFPLCPQNKRILENDFKDVDYLIKHKLEHYTPNFKLICDQHDKKNYLVHYRNIKFFVRLGMRLEKFIR